MPSATGTLRWSAINHSRKRSTLQPLPQPLPGPGVPETDIYIPMSPPPRSGIPHLIRPLVLPSPPTSPSCLAGADATRVGAMRSQPNQLRLESLALPPWPQTRPYTWPRPVEDISHVRKLDSVPMFRFSDLENVQNSAIAQRYMSDRLDTPRATPYSITAMLNDSESPLLPSPPPVQSTIGTDEYHDIDEQGGVPLGLPTTPSPTSASPPLPVSVGLISTVIDTGSSPHRANPPLRLHNTPSISPAATTTDTTHGRQKHLSLGSCDMDISPLSPLPPSTTFPSASTQTNKALPPTSKPLLLSLPISTNPNLSSRYLLHPTTKSFILSPGGHPYRTRSIGSASTGMSVSPRTPIPPYWMLSRAALPSDVGEENDEEKDAGKGKHTMETNLKMTRGRRGWWDPSASSPESTRSSVHGESMEGAASEGDSD